jgi:ubiquinone/menaquinone biosynthesis C-methylase UbiE
MAKQSNELIRNAYDRAAHSYAESFYHELYSKPLDVKLLDLFCDRVDPKFPVCEIGCGPGEISSYLKYKGLDMIGIDISAEMIRIAKKLNPAIKFQTGDVFKLDFSNNSFSGVLAPFLFVNHEFKEIRKGIKEINRVLISGGIFYMTFHTDGDRIAVEDFLVEQNPLEFIFLNVDEVLELLINCGFEIIESIVRYPYKDVEHQNKRAYIFARKV